MGLGGEEGSPAGAPGLAAVAAPLALGETAPDPVVDRDVHRVGKALGLHGALATDRFRLLVL